mmetsp:Transcript_41540/g.104759  ORF Transcript_41540/g.104759 Transcript_41540/m.104759 type:complete len:142 (-) Transcript_41540:135-560(-)
MTCIHPGEHGSTYGGNPIAAAVGIASLEVLVEERLAERADELGQKLRSDLTGLNIPFVKEVRGRGLLNAIEIDPSYKHSAWAVCQVLKDRGLLAKPTRDTVIRLAPPLVMSDEDMAKCTDIISSTLKDIDNIDPSKLDQGH